MICKELKGEGPKYAGDATITAKPTRSYALMWPQDPANSYKPGEEFFQQRLKNSAASHSLTSSVPAQRHTNPGQAQQEAQTFMAKFQAMASLRSSSSAIRITPVYFTTPPPGSSTSRVDPNRLCSDGHCLLRTAIRPAAVEAQLRLQRLARPGAAGVERCLHLYYWQFQKTPAAPSSYGTIYPSIWAMMLGINLAAAADPGDVPVRPAAVHDEDVLGLRMYRSEISRHVRVSISPTKCKPESPTR